MALKGGGSQSLAREDRDRYGHVVTHCEFSIAIKTDADRDLLRALARDIQAESVERARRTIPGAVD